MVPNNNGTLWKRFLKFLPIIRSVTVERGPVFALKLHQGTRYHTNTIGMDRLS